MKSEHFQAANLLLFFLLTFTRYASAQYTVITLGCDSLMGNCDTLFLEKYNPSAQLVEKIKKGQASGRILYTYDENGKLIRKEHFNESNRLQKQNRIQLDANGEWKQDSLLDNSGKLLYLFKREKRVDRENTWQIDWYFSSDTSASTRQLIQYDAVGNEISNSTCYSADNCITYRFSYQNKHKSYSELWVYQPGGTNPELKETEEWYFENDDYPKGSVRFVEPEHRIVARFKYIVVR